MSGTEFEIATGESQVMFTSKQIEAIVRESQKKWSGVRVEYTDEAVFLVFPVALTELQIMENALTLTEFEHLKGVGE